MLPYRALTRTWNTWELLLLSAFFPLAAHGKKYLSDDATPRIDRGAKLHDHHSRSPIVDARLHAFILPNPRSFISPPPRSTSRDDSFDDRSNGRSTNSNTYWHSSRVTFRFWWSRPCRAWAWDRSRSPVAALLSPQDEDSSVQMGTMIKKKKKWNDRRSSPSDPREGKKLLPSGPVEVATCGSRLNRVDRRDPNEGLIGSPRGSSTRLWRRPIVPPSACPVPTEYPKFQLDYTSAPVPNFFSFQRISSRQRFQRQWFHVNPVRKIWRRRKERQFEIENEEISLTLVPMDPTRNTYKAVEKKRVWDEAGCCFFFLFFFFSFGSRCDENWRKWQKFSRVDARLILSPRLFFLFFFFCFKRAKETAQQRCEN